LGIEIEHREGLRVERDWMSEKLKTEKKNDLGKKKYD